MFGEGEQEEQKQEGNEGEVVEEHVSLEKVPPAEQAQLLR